MILLHAARRPDGLWLWGEQPAANAAVDLATAMGEAGLATSARKEPVVAWLPAVGEGPVAGRFAALVRAMPAAFRALGADSRRPPDLPAAVAVSGLVDALADHLVRTAQQGVAPSERQDRTFDSLHDQWRHALTSAD